MKELKFLKNSHKKMSKEELDEYEASLKPIPTNDLIIKALLLEKIGGIRFKQQSYLIIAELDERGIL